MKKSVKIVLIVLGVLLVVGVVGFQYLKSNGLSGQYANTDAKEGQIKVACVGDSITYGHGITDWEDNNYPAQLQKMLGDDYHVANFGSSGACVNPNGDQPYISREVYQNGLDYEADVLVFMLGTNDSKPENWTNMDDFMKNYKELLNSYLTEVHRPSKIYVGLCAEAYYTSDEERATGVAGYDIQPAIVDEIAAEIETYFVQYEAKVKIIDVHTLTEAHPEWFEKDGIHPNNDGAKAIAELVAEAIQ